MLKLRTALHAYLLTLHPRVHFKKAPDDTSFPYIVYDFKIISDGEATSLVNLDLNGWDDKSDTIALENLMTTINNINKNVISNEDLTVVFYLDDKIPLIDEDPTLNRRKYVYIGKLFERG